MTTTPELHGTVASGFEPVADAFLANFDGPIGEVGAACAVYVDGTEVLNVSAGLADPVLGTPWDDKTIVGVASTTKGMVGIAVNRLVEQGLLGLDAPVAEYWPEFAAAGKEELPLRMLLNHQAGLPYFDEPVTPDEVLAGVVPTERLAAQAPVWEPGSTFGYHAITYGWLLGEVVRRVTGRTVGQYFAEEIAGPLGLSAWIGLPDEHHHRVARQVHTPPGGGLPDHPLMGHIVNMVQAMADPGSLTTRSFTLNGSLDLAPPDDPDPAAEKAWWRAELAGIGGIADAASLARLYAACVSTVDGIRLLSADTVRNATVPQNEEGVDAVTCWPAVWGLGFMLPSVASPLLGPGSFGFPGSGGSAGYGDPAARIGFGYVCNKMGPPAFLDNRKRLITEALRKLV